MKIRRHAKAIVLVFLLLWLTGCGQTIRGVGDDMRRMGNGFKTIFISE